MRTIDELLKEAYDVQDACNLSGVVHSFSRAMSELRENGINDTAALNTHPVCRMYSDKIRALAFANETELVDEFTALEAAYSDAADAMKRLESQP